MFFCSYLEWKLSKCRPVKRLKGVICIKILGKIGIPCIFFKIQKILKQKEFLRSCDGLLRIQTNLLLRAIHFPLAFANPSRIKAIKDSYIILIMQTRLKLKGDSKSSSCLGHVTETHWAP